MLAADRPDADLRTLADEIVSRLCVLSKVQQGVKDIDAGRTFSTDELAREIEAW